MVGASTRPADRGAKGVGTTMAKLVTVRTVAALRRAVGDWRRAAHSVGLVPTMGALHAGHLALVSAAREDNDRVIASLFVNPTQFGPNEDLTSYPRDEDEDGAKLEARGVDLLFAPNVAEIYPAGFATTVAVAGLTEGLCGAHRPGHFTGVTTVVGKLLIQSLPDRAYFGEKDYQQLTAIRRMARDLDLPTEIVGVATVREADGLALSSRNAYLSAPARVVAADLNRVLHGVAEAVAGGADPAEESARGIAALLAAGFDEVDYLAVCDAETLAPVTVIDRPARVFAAAHIDGTRLIDNRPVPGHAD